MGPIRTGHGRLQKPGEKNIPDMAEREGTPSQTNNIEKNINNIARLECYPAYRSTMTLPHMHQKHLIKSII